MIKHWKFTKHFAERVLVRVGPDFDNTIAAIKREFDDTVLQKVFDCKVRGDSQRRKVGNFVVCYVWDESKKKIMVTTLFDPSQK